jgi:Ca2+-binding RTX toxin-like protein
MRKTLLLLTTMSLTLMLAGGVALAATKQCQVGVLCNGTPGADAITGTTSNDTINSLAGNDSISARGGNDKINGGPNNDTMNGGLGNDTYRFATSWGADRISADRGGVDTLSFVQHSTAYPNGRGVSASLTGDGSNLCPPDSNPCFTIQGGDYIENLVGTRFADELFGNTLNNRIDSGGGGDLFVPNFLDGQAGGDTYAGYAPGATASRVDVIVDRGGSPNIDKLDLARFDLADVSFAPFAGTSGSANIDTLYIDLPGDEHIYLWTYFDGTSTDVCANGSGTGLVEKISFADDSNVDYAQVKQLLGCPGGAQPATSDWLPPNVKLRDHSEPLNWFTTNLTR